MNMAPNSMTMPMSDPSVWAQAMSSLGMPPLNMTGQQLMPGTTENMLHYTVTVAAHYSTVNILMLES